MYHYDLTDHLGNTRLTFSEEDQLMTSKASMEAGVALVEEAVFEGVAERRQTLAFHNTTKASSREPEPNKVATLLPGQQGPSRSLSVRKGDQVHLQVNARYESGKGKAQGLEGVATQLAGGGATHGGWPGKRGPE